MKGIAIKQTRGSVGVSKINSMFKKCKEYGKVYYSTNIIIVDAPSFSEILFCLNYKGKFIFVVADIVSYEGFSKGKGIPSDCHDFMCDSSNIVACRNWFLVNNMREVSLNYVKRLKVVKIDGSTTSLLENLSKPKLNRLDYVDVTLDDEDVLIKY